MSNIIALDVGDVRVGVARANTIALIPEPLITLKRDDNFWTELKKIFDADFIEPLVVGLPRSLSGDETAQTKKVRDFVEELKTKLGIEVTLQDEALTSVKAHEELSLKGKTYSKGEVDSLAASYILGDYIATNRGVYEK